MAGPWRRDDEQSGLTPPVEFWLRETPDGFAVATVTRRSKGYRWAVYARWAEDPWGEGGAATVAAAQADADTRLKGEGWALAEVEL